MTLGIHQTKNSMTIYIPSSEKKIDNKTVFKSFKDIIISKNVKKVIFNEIGLPKLQLPDWVKHIGVYRTEIEFISFPKDLQSLTYENATQRKFPKNFKTLLHFKIFNGDHINSWPIFPDSTRSIYLNECNTKLPKNIKLPTSLVKLHLPFNGGQLRFPKFDNNKKMRLFVPNRNITNWSKNINKKLKIDISNDDKELLDNVPIKWKPQLLTNKEKELKKNMFMFDVFKI
jgi:hypothetical protein